MEPGANEIIETKIDQNAERDRITVHSVFTYESFGDSATQAISFHSRNSSVAGEQPYIRKLRKLEGTIDLPLGHISDPGTIIVKNVTGKHLLVLPTEEEKETIETAIVLFDGYEIHPRDFLRVSPRRGRNIPTIQVPVGIVADIEVYVFPR